MGKKQKVKYRVIPETIMKDIVEFIDEMQFEASKLNTTESHHVINLCNYLISCLINSDSFTDDFSVDKDEDPDDENIHEIPDEAFDWDSNTTDFKSYDFDDMSDEDYDEMLRAADELFLDHHNKHKSKNKYNGKTKRVNGNGNMTLEQFKKELKKDRELTPEEKFELYYHERELRNNKLASFDSFLKKSGLKKSTKNKK